MKKIALVRSVLSVAIGTTAATNINAADEAFQQQVEERLSKLEQASASSSGQTTSGNWLEKIEFAGLIEIEGGYLEGYDDASYSDIVVATVELGMEAAINDDVTATLIFLYEEDDTPFDVDVATLTFDNLVGEIDLIIGKQYLPFGVFETALVNDTLVLELAETNKTAAVVNFFEQDGFTAGAFLFKGDVDRENNLETFGLTGSYQADNYLVGAQFMSSALESDGAVGAIGNPLLVEDGGSALVLNGSIDLENIRIIGEFLQTITDAELINGAELKPQALQLELNFPVQLNSQDWVLAAAIQTTDDAAVLGQPEQRFSFGGATQLDDNLSFAVEFFQDSDYDTNDGGTGESGMGIIAQVAAEF